MSARSLTLRDLVKVQTIAEKCFAKRWSESDYRYFLMGECARSYGLFEGDELVSYALTLVAQGDLDTVSIGTDPKHQRKGLAAWCLSAMEKMGDVKRLYLEVDESNTAAIALYGKQGFRVYGRRKKYYQGLRDAILMQKTIPE